MSVVVNAREWTDCRSSIPKRLLPRVIRHLGCRDERQRRHKGMTADSVIVTKRMPLGVIFSLEWPRTTCHILHQNQGWCADDECSHRSLAPCSHRLECGRAINEFVGCPSNAHDRQRIDAITQFLIRMQEFEPFAACRSTNRRLKVCLQRMVSIGIRNRSTDKKNGPDIGKGVRRVEMNLVLSELFQKSKFVGVTFSRGDSNVDR